MDRFADVCVVNAESQNIGDTWLPDLISLAATGYLKIHPRSASRTPSEERRRLAPEEPAWGPRRTEVIVTEHGVRYLVKPPAGLSVGLFLDMREVRQWLRGFTRGMTVLNLFAYTCSLGACAALGGAARVVNVDVSRGYLEWGKANYVLNQLEVDDHDFIYGEAFDWLNRFARREQVFDLVVIDPPSFSSTPFSVTRDYTRLVSAAARAVSRGGTLLAATNHAATSDMRFEAWLMEGLSNASRRGRFRQRWHEPSVDFPIAGRPYLKVRAIELD